MSIEGLRNIIHREIRRVLDRQTRRVPCTVDSYNPQQHTIKLKLQPEGTLTGWVQIAADQVGVQIAPNIGDPGWLDFHEADRRAAVFSGSNHNDLNPPPVQIAAGEWRTQNKTSGAFLYVKNDGSVIANDGAGGSVLLKGGVITATDKAGSTALLNGDGTAKIAAASGLTIDANTTVNGILTVNGDIMSTGGAAGTISVQNHTHPGVQGGPSNTQPPVG